MALPGSSQAELYRQGLTHFNRGEWAAAIQAFTELQEAGSQYADVDELLADARLKLQFDGADAPIALAPPRQSLVMPLLMAIPLLLLVFGGYVGFQWLNRAEPVTAIALPTAAPATPTIRAQATVRPTDIPVPTAIAPGIVTIKAADGQSFITTPRNIDIILDASGSMLAAGADGVPRWQVAQQALDSVLDSGAIPLESYVGIRTYGRNRGRDCTDLEAALQLEPYSYERALATVNGIKPVSYGMTPLAASLRAASQDLAQVDGSSVVILLTDGVESCDGDPVKEATDLVAGGTDRKVHVVGFAIDDAAATQNLQNIAAAGNGLYFDAANSSQLAAALQQAVVLNYTIKTASGETVATGNVGQDPIELKAGSYRMEIPGSPPLDFSVTNGGNTEISLSQIGGVIQAEVAP